MPERNSRYGHGAQGGSPVALLTPAAPEGRPMVARGERSNATRNPWSALEPIGTRGLLAGGSPHPWLPSVAPPGLQFRVLCGESRIRQPLLTATRAFRGRYNRARGFGCPRLLV